MPFATHSNQSSGGFEQPFSQAGFLQVVAPELPNPAPTTIGAGATWDSGVIYSDGYRYLTCGVNLTQAGSVIFTQYIDTGATMARTTLATSLTANTLAIADVSDLKPFVCYRVQVINSGVSAATLSSFGLLMSAG